MAIPRFNQQGLLPSGLHVCSGDEFLERFCSDGVRKNYANTLTEVFNYAGSRNVGNVFVGGSFVTSEAEPRDIDIVIAFRTKEHIPSRGERLSIEGRRLDIMFASEDEPRFLDAYLNLLGQGRYDESPGIIQVAVSGSGADWKITHSHEDEAYEVIRRAYCDRELIDLLEPVGLLITVHGIMSNASWNTHVMPIASSQGWIVAPFYYGIQLPTVLFSGRRRRKLVDEFREWLDMVSRSYASSASGAIAISAIGHSFGTYLLGAYIDGFEHPPVEFDSIILAGSILNEDFDWAGCAGVKVGKVLNEVVPNDQVVKWMPTKLASVLGLDPLFGVSGVKGFKSTSTILEQRTNAIFDHNNVIRADVVRTQWMPFLNSNCGALRREAIKRYKQDK